MNKKENEMREQAKQDIIERLQDGFSGYYADLHNEVFNTDYYIIGTYQAKEALNEYDTFEAIDKIQEYEKDNFGEVTTDLSNPEKLINMLYYIIGEEVLNSMMENIESFQDNWNNSVDDEINQEVLKELGV